MMPRLLVIFVAMFLSLPTAARGESPAPNDPLQAPDLRPRFRQGQVSRYQIWTLRNQDITVNMNGQNQTASTGMEVTGEATWAIDLVRADGSASCVMTLDWIAVTLTASDGSSLQNDSRRSSGDNEMMHRILRAMAGVPMKIEVAPDGTIRGSSGSDAVKRRAGGEIKTPDDLDFMESASDLATLAGAPAQATPGRSWDTAATWNHDMGKLQQQTRYTLASLEEIAGIPVATVTGSASLRLEPDMSKFPKTSPDGSPAPKVDIRMTSGKASMQVMVDLQRHEAVGRNTVQESVIETRVRLQNQSLTRTTRERVQSQALRIEER
jgi:hypothetical protein